VELTVLGCSGSFGHPTGGACSGYLLRQGATLVWVDCGNGTLANLQRHADPADLSAVVITHQHPDHCVDLYGLHVLWRYGYERRDLPVFTPAGVEGTLGALVGGDFGGAFAFHALGDGDAVDVGELHLAFSRTDHPPPTLAVEATGGGKRLVYTSDTGPDWTVGAFAPGADLVVSEATYQGEVGPTAIHLTATQAGEGARAAQARRLLVTHVWPFLDPAVSVAEAEAAFGRPVTLAAPHLTVRL
jgi:ribonuclease BN (tRNA processing enzyme)